MKSYKIKYRSQKYDGLISGWYIYSRHYAPQKKGLPFRRYRIAGPYRIKGDAVMVAGILALKSREFVNKILNMRK